jgi:hypothetical protein
MEHRAEVLNSMGLSRISRGKIDNNPHFSWLYKAIWLQEKSRFKASSRFKLKIHCIVPEATRRS